MTISPQSVESREEAPLKKLRTQDQPILGFSEDDNEGIIQSHDDALVLTLQIAGFDVKKVMIDQGSGVEIIYLDLFKGLRLKLDDLSNYDIPLVGFDGNTIIPKEMIRLPMQTESKVVNVDFIIVEACSPYTTILARPWLHAMGAVSLTLHVKVKYPTEKGVRELLGCQAVARQCIAVAIRHQVFEVGSSESNLTL